MKINKLILVTFSILLLLMSFTINIGSDSSSNNDNRFHYELMGQKSKIPFNIQSNPQTVTQGEMITPNSETVIFVDSPTEFKFLKNLYMSSISKIYENLFALKIKIPLHVLKNQPEVMHLTMFPSQAFENFKLPIVQEISLTYKNLQLNQISDKANLLGIDTLWAAGYNGTGVNIAVMDNGIDFTHPALTNKSVGMLDISNDADPCKEHGTRVAGLIAGNQIDNNIDVLGMAYGSNLYDISFGCVGNEIEGDILDGFDYILEKNATIDVVNTSFGGSAPSWDFIIEKLETAGIVLVGSAGNSGPGFHSTTTGGPGNSIHGISVGSSSNTGQQLSIFSARGPVYNMLYKPDLIAPGENINSTTNLGGYETQSGTSFSSPIVAGGVSSLISALNSLGYNWNPGVIKAALLNTAENITNNELLDGQGLVNFTSALNFISTSNIGSDNIPQLISLTPKVGPISYVANVPQGMILNLPLTMISSHPTDVGISFTGDLNGITTNSFLKNTYSQVLELQIDTTSVTPSSILLGSVIATLNGTTAVTQLRINIGEPIKGKIGIDLGHTYWDDTGDNGIGSSNTGEMIRLAMLKGYAIEHITDKINETVLSEYDIFWMPDPNSLMDTGTPSLLEQGYQQNILFDSEINAIVDFVENGGSLLIDFNGLMNTSDGLSPEIMVGLNATGLNKLINNFGIEASTQPIVKPLGHVTVDLVNQSSLVGEAKKYTHEGNYLQLSGNAQPLAITNGGLITAATYGNPNTGGRVLVSSSNFWMDNLGILGGYLGALLNNRILAENTINWLDQESRVIKTAEDISPTTISGSFVAFENNSISATIPDLYIEGNNLVTYESITPFNHGNGTYSFSYSHSGQGIFRVIATLGSDYVVWEDVIDILGPTISILDGNKPNGSRYEDDIFYIFEFKVLDDLAGVNPDSTIIRIDNNIIDPSIDYKAELNILSVILRADEFQTKNLGEFYKLQISISDKSGNMSVYVYHFQIGEPVNKTDTGTNSSSTSKKQPGESNLIFDNIDIWIIAVLLITIIGLLYKNYTLKKSSG